MGLGDFLGGVKDAVGKGLDVASGPVGDAVIDITTEPLEQAGRGIGLVGDAVQGVSDASGWLGDRAEGLADRVGLNDPVSSRVINFASGGGLEWVGDSVADLAQTAENVGTNIDTVQKGALEAANFVYDNPTEAADLTAKAVGAGARYAYENPDEIAKFAGKVAWDTVTDPVNIALAVGTGGTSLAAGGLSAAAARGGAQAGVRAGARQLAREVGEQGVRATAKQFGRDVAEGAVGEAAALSRGDRFLTGMSPRGARNVATGRDVENLGAISRGRRALAQRVAGDTGEGVSGGFLRQHAANVVQGSHVPPSYGGQASRTYWQQNRALSPVLGTRGTRAAVHATAYPRDWAVDKLDEIAANAERGEYDGLLGEIAQSGQVQDALNKIPTSGLGGAALAGGLTTGAIAAPFLAKALGGDDEGEEKSKSVSSRSSSRQTESGVALQGSARNASISQPSSPYTSGRGFSGRTKRIEHQYEESPDVRDPYAAGGLVTRVGTQVRDPYNEEEPQKRDQPAAARYDTLEPLVQPRVQSRKY